MSQVDDLIQSLQSADETDRRYAIEDLGDLKDAAAAPALCQLLMDSSALIREAAIEALQKLDPTVVAPLCVPAIASENVPARNAGLDVLFGLGTASYPVLRDQLLRTSSSDLKKFALDTLLRIADFDPQRDHELIADIRACFKDENDNVAGAAIEVLATGKDLMSPSELTQFIGRGSWLEINAIMALERLGAAEALKAFAARAAELSRAAQASLQRTLKKVA